ncbi:hypothetical protein [Ruania zhangjianzhongii]|uniref:hypothetical protein n=1 Tax=Ruania zhangjianzhongii TaxID=2603206 RepID=UPI0011C876E6|nr:hypothetical protein [Ruania zhangjianzhongii]
MSITQNARRTLTALGAAGLLTTGVLAGALPVAAAPSSSDPNTPATIAAPDGRPALAAPAGEVTPNGSTYHCSPNWCYQTIWDNAANDDGGRWAQSILHVRGDDLDTYTASFWPRGERLNLLDNLSDGHQARANVEVRDRNDNVVDRDTFYTSSNTDFNLGTPDGTGNIPEGYQVWIQVCVGDTDHCAPWVLGYA